MLVKFPQNYKKLQYNEEFSSKFFNWLKKFAVINTFIMNIAEKLTSVTY